MRTRVPKLAPAREDKRDKTRRVRTRINLKLPGSGVQLIGLFHALPVRQSSHSSGQSVGGTVRPVMQTSLQVLSARPGEAFYSGENSEDTLPLCHWK